MIVIFMLNNYYSVLFEYVGKEIAMHTKADGKGKFFTNIKCFDMESRAIYNKD